MLFKYERRFINIYCGRYCKGTSKEDYRSIRITPELRYVVLEYATRGTQLKFSRDDWR